MYLREEIVLSFTENSKCYFTNEKSGEICFFLLPFKFSIYLGLLFSGASSPYEAEFNRMGQYSTSSHSKILEPPYVYFAVVVMEARSSWQ